MKKINAAETEFAKVCLKKDGHVNMHAREHVFVNDGRNGNEIRIQAAATWRAMTRRGGARPAATS